MSDNGANQKGFLQKNWMWLAGCGCLVVIVLIAALIGGYFLLRDGGGSHPAPAASSSADDDDSGKDTGSSSSGGGSSRNDIIVYSANEDFEFFTQELYSVEPNGDNNTRLVFNSEGMLYLTLTQNYLSVIESDDNGEGKLSLVNAREGTSTFLDNQIIIEGFYRTISKDGSRFAHIQYDEDNEVITLVVFSMNGELVASVDDYLPMEFLSNSEILVFYFDADQGYFDGFGVLDLDTGEYRELSDLKLYDDLAMFPKASSDGRYVFYGDEDGLMRVDVGSGSETFLYAFDDTEYYNYDFLPSLTFFAETDQALFYERGNLYLFDVDEGPGELIASNVYGFASGMEIIFSQIPYVGDYYIAGSGVVGAPFVVSPNGRLLAYLVINDDEEVFELNIYSFSDGSVTTISSGNGWYKYAFTPDSRSLVAVEFDDYFDAMYGKLFVVDVDGANRTVLDTDVTSFALSGNGRSVYYAAVTDENELTSGIFSIGLNGSERTEIVVDIVGAAWIADFPD